MYKISIDTGGTFTDCICEKDGEISRLKLLSKSVLRSEIVEILSENSIRIKDNWGFEKDFFEGFFFKILGENQIKFRVKSFKPKEKILEFDLPIFQEKSVSERSFELFTEEEVPVFAIRLLTQTPLNQSFPSLELKLGSTKGTNALLEAKGAKVLFLVTKGFRDLLKIGNQARPDIFVLNVIKSIPLHTHVIEVDEQIDSSGRTLIPINLKKVYSQIESANISFDSIAICFKNSYKNAIHEIELSKFLGKYSNNISVSTNLSSQIKFVPRAETTVVNAYLSPIIDKYIRNIQSKLLNNFLVMTSAGTLVTSNNFHPKDSLLSGPAGGIVGAARVANQSGFTQIISFDMGGTSTDVARYDGDFDYKSEITIRSATIFSPALSIETVAAGGGSICSFDGFKLTVGPQSAGSEPGPACYGAGGPLTITDVNLLLGRLDTTYFSIPIYKKYAKEKFEVIIQSIESQGNAKVNREEVLESFLQIANEKMTEAIRKISVSKGFDAAEYGLVAFGGAGGMHACAIANLLSMSKIIIPSDAGLLSAYGISKSKLQKIVEKPVLQEFSKHNILELQKSFDSLTSVAFEQLAILTGSNVGVYVKKRTLQLRIKGQDNSLDIDFDGKIDFDREFETFKANYIKVYSYWQDNLSVEIASIVVQVAENEIDNSGHIIFKVNGKVEYFPEPIHKKQAFINNQWSEIPVYSREMLAIGATITGFALLIDPFATTVIEQGWTLTIDENFTAIISKNSEFEIKKTYSEQAELELFTNRFMAVAEQMGVMLQRTSLSVNVKERLDFSCALLDSKARLIANAPHIPVHLGSLGVCVRTVLAKIKIEKDDVIITNHPKYGGSHLPDVTLISSVYSADNELIGYVVSRCHHSEIGGIRPASMPPNAKKLEEEGVVIEPVYLVKNGISQFENVKLILQNAKYSTRSINENMADISAALAANNRGKEALLQMVNNFGQVKVASFMEKLLEHSNKMMVDKFKEFGESKFEATELLDDGTELKVEISISESGFCTFDFTGTSAVHKGNLNANIAIVSSVVVYVLRLLIQKPIPLNEGLMMNVTLIVPENTILNPIFDENPAFAPAVVGGNVETSQRLTDTILKAFELVACSQGTMNNTLFGNEKFGYYETICGGTGAGNGFDGASGVHSHMTNTRITDPEIMELRYPVRLNRFEIRENSGGNGKFNGGNGIVREIEFLAPVKLSVLSQHRKVAPFGLLGGEAGSLGNQYIIKENGGVISLSGYSAADLEAGDRFVIETPGGGGWGESV
ncbi:MAG: hydantoinase B/oxoprolinase family protein [Bacteroidota bacterium]